MFNFKKNKNDNPTLFDENIETTNNLDINEIENNDIDENIDITNDTKNTNKEKRIILIIGIASISLLIVFCLLLKIGISSKINDINEPNFPKSTNNEIILNDEEIELKNIDKKDVSYFSKIKQNIYNLKNEYQSKYSSLKTEDTIKSNYKTDTKNEDNTLDDKNNEDNTSTNDINKNGDENKDNLNTNETDTEITNDNHQDSKNGTIVNSINRYNYNELQQLLNKNISTSNNSNNSNNTNNDSNSNSNSNTISDSASYSSFINDCEVLQKVCDILETKRDDDSTYGEYGTTGEEIKIKSYLKDAIDRKSKDDTKSTVVKKLDSKIIKKNLSTNLKTRKIEDFGIIMNGDLKGTVVYLGNDNDQTTGIKNNNSIYFGIGIYK